MITYHRGHPEEGERLCRQARTWFERTGDSYFQVQNLVRGLAIFALADGRPRRRRRGCARRFRSPLQIGGWVAVEAYRYLVEALVAQDRLDDARELVVFAARNLPEEDAYARSSLLLAEAIVATAAGESATAATAFAEALRLIEELNVPLELGEARMALGMSLRRFGDLTGAAPSWNGRARSSSASARTRGAKRSTPSSHSWWRGRLPPAPPPLASSGDWRRRHEDAELADGEAGRVRGRDGDRRDLRFAGAVEPEVLGSLELPCTGTGPEVVPSCAVAWTSKTSKMFGSA